VPRSLFRRGLRLKSSMMSAMMRCLRSPALISSFHRRPALAQDRLLEVVQVLGLLLEPLVDGGLRGQPLRHVARLVLQVEHHLVGHRLVELVGVDVGAEDVARHLLVLAQQRRAGEADEDGALQPALHLLVHVAALGAVAFVHEDVEAAHAPAAARALQVGRRTCGSARTAGAAWRPQLLDQLRPRGDARRWRVGADHPGVLHHALDLLVQLVAVGDDQDAGLGSCSSSHLAISTIRMLLPLPWVCQITPPSRWRCAPAPP
jgi:hypothetical protein